MTCLSLSMTGLQPVRGRTQSITGVDLAPGSAAYDDHVSGQTLDPRPVSASWSLVDVVVWV